MQILFAISILCFLVLLWAAVAMTRRIRASHRLERSSTQSQPDFSQYLLAAAQGNSTSESSNMQPATQTIASFQDKATSPKRG
jgi:hypothetical protein